MNALTIGLALLVVGCAAIGDVAPQLDSAGATVMRAGGCLRVVADFPPLSNVRLRPGSCQQ